MNSIFTRNKKHFSSLLRSSRLNEMTLSEYKTIYQRVNDLKKIKKHGVLYDWDNADFDRNLGWLCVQQYIASPLKEEGCVSIFTSLEELPQEQVSKFKHLFNSK